MTGWFIFPLAALVRLLVSTHQGLQSNNKHVSVSMASVTVHQALLTNSRFAFHMQEWYNLTEDDVLRLQRTPPLVSVLFDGWLFRLQSNNKV